MVFFSCWLLFWSSLLFYFFSTSFFFASRSLLCRHRRLFFFFRSNPIFALCREFLNFSTFFFSVRYFDSFRKYAMNSPLFFDFFVSFGSTTLTPIDSYIILFLQDSFQLFLGDLFDHWLMIGRCRRRWCWCWCFFCTTHVGWKACKCK